MTAKERADASATQSGAATGEGSGPDESQKPQNSEIELEVKATEVKATSEECCGGSCRADKGSEATVDPAEEKTNLSELESDWKVQAAYLAAEIENMKKRHLREISELRKYANEELLKKIVPVLDTLSLALNAAEKSVSQPENEVLRNHKTYQAMIQGIQMTSKQFRQVLEACGVDFIDSVGKGFDPILHEALGRSSKADVGDNIVSEEFEPGFKLFGRVIRPSKVIVNKTQEGNEV